MHAYRKNLDFFHFRELTRQLEFKCKTLRASNQMQDIKLLEKTI